MTKFDSPVKRDIHGDFLSEHSQFDKHLWDSNAQDLREYTHLRTTKIPFLLEYLVDRKRLTQDQSDSLTVQLNSPDREAWYMAFLIIIQITNPKFLIPKWGHDEVSEDSLRERSEWASRAKRDEASEWSDWKDAERTEECTNGGF